MPKCFHFSAIINQLCHYSPMQPFILYWSRDLHRSTRFLGVLCFCPESVSQFVFDQTGSKQTPYQPWWSIFGLLQIFGAVKTSKWKSAIKSHQIKKVDGKGIFDFVPNKYNQPISSLFYSQNVMCAHLQADLRRHMIDKSGMYDSV